MKAIVFNCHYNGLAIIQELGRHGVPVLALDSSRTVGTMSRYANFQRCPDPSIAEDAFIAFLLRIGSDFYEKPILFPTNDHWAVAISRHKATLLKYYIPCVADYSAIELVIEKQRFYEWANIRKIPVPRSCKILSKDKIPEITFPLAAKPECRRTASNDPLNSERSIRFDSMRLTVLRNKNELDYFCRCNKSLLPYFLFQEYVEGLSDCMYTIGVYADLNYEVRALFSGRKIRGYPPDIGDCIVGQNEDVPLDLKKLVKTICHDIKYHGIAEFEFKRDAVTGDFKLIEINPRSWSWIGITPACEVSLPWIAYRDLSGIGGDVGYTESNLPNGSIKYAKILADFQNCLFMNRRAGYSEWNFTLKSWWKSLDANRLVVAEFASDDWKPSIYSVMSTLRSLLVKLVRRLFMISLK